MEIFLHSAVIALLSVVFAALLKKGNQELGLLLSLGACVLIGGFVLQLAEPVVDFLGKLRSLAGLDMVLMTPLLKSIGMGILAQICSCICKDGGESALAGLIELCGTLLALYLSLPLLEAVIETVERVSGG